MAKVKTPASTAPDNESVAASLRERVEMVLFIAVEVFCLLLFLDFLFFGLYVK